MKLFRVCLWLILFLPISSVETPFRMIPQLLFCVMVDYFESILYRCFMEGNEYTKLKILEEEIDG
jgi:hypothetical protein